MGQQVRRASLMSGTARGVGPRVRVLQLGRLASLGFICTLLAACASGTPPPTPVATATSVPEGRIYVVQPGDNGVGEIAARECGDWSRWRQIESADGAPLDIGPSGDPIIREGEWLRLPASCDSATSANGATGGAERERTAAAATPDDATGATPAIPPGGAPAVVLVVAAIVLCLLGPGLGRPALRGWRRRRQLSALARTRRGEAGFAEATRLLDAIVRALLAEHVDAAVLLIAEASTGYEVLLRNGPLSAPMSSAHVSRIARRLGTVVRLKSRVERWTLLSTGFSPEPQSPDAQRAGTHPLRRLGRDDSGNALYHHIAVRQPLMLVEVTGGLRVLLPYLTEHLQIAAGEDYRVWADHGAARLAGSNRTGSGSTAEIAAYLAGAHRALAAGGLVVLAPQSREPLGHIAALAAVGGLDLVAAAGRSLLADCTLFTIDGRPPRFRITVTVPGIDFQHELFISVLQEDRVWPDIAVLPPDETPETPLPPSERVVPSSEGRDEPDVQAEADDPGEPAATDDAHADPAGAAEPPQSGDGPAHGGSTDQAQPVPEPPDDMRGDDATGDESAGQEAPLEGDLDYLDDRLFEDIPFASAMPDLPRPERASDAVPALDRLLARRPVHIEVCGDVRVYVARDTGDYEELMPRREKPRQLLAFAAMDQAFGARTVPSELAAQLWAGNSNTVRNVLYRARTDLRKALGLREGTDPLPVKEGELVFSTALCSSDLLLLRRLVEASDVAASRGDTRTAFRYLQAARDLVRGEPLRDLPGAWPATTRSAIEREIARVTVRGRELALELGHPEEDVGFAAAARRAGVTEVRLDELE